MLPCVCRRPLPMYTSRAVRLSTRVGAIDRRGQQNALFVTLLGRAKGMTLKLENKVKSTQYVRLERLKEPYSTLFKTYKRGM